MAIKTLLWDIGGVFLTNGWDTVARHRLAERFQLDFAAFEARHKVVVDAFERGHLSEDEYWRQTVCAEVSPHPVNVADLRAFMRAQSQPFEDSLAVLRDLSRRRQWQLVALNNEALELNLYRIEQFGLAQHFNVFLSSCFLDARKPDALIFERAMQILQRRPEECVFTDDREENLVYPRLQGWHTIPFQGPQALREELRRLGVDPARAA